MRANQLFDLLPGDFPHDAVFKTLGVEADPGPVKFSAPAQRHAMRRHPQDLPRIIPSLSKIIISPLYMGDDFRNPGKIEFVGRIPGLSGGALIALTVDRNETDGYYHVCSAYMISQADLDRKRDKNVLKVVRHS